MNSSEPGGMELYFGYQKHLWTSSITKTIDKFRNVKVSDTKNGMFLSHMNSYPSYLLW